MEQARHPQALGPGRTPLASGLPSDPEAAARAYLAGNRDLFGMDATEVASMERVLVRPIGSGTVVTLRQRFGDLPAGPDGLVTLAVADGRCSRSTPHWPGPPPHQRRPPAPPSRRTRPPSPTPD
ncbi:hypothetical protein NKG94_23325 [Micromonospora sp. M12]